MGTAEISLIVSGVSAAAAIGTGVITYRLANRRFDHERRLSDLDAVRRVLDDASAALRQMEAAAEQALGRLDHYAEQAPAKLRDDPLAVEDLAAMATARENIDALTSRLEIRFGSEHEVVAIYEAARAAAISAGYLVGLIVREYVSPPTIAVETHREGIERAVAELAIGRRSFNLTAYRVAGVRLPAAQLGEMTA